MSISWEDINYERGELYIKKTLQRVCKEALEEITPETLYFVFPPKQKEKKSVLILKKPKTNKSIRTIYMTAELQEELKKREKNKEKPRKSEIFGV